MFVGFCEFGFVVEGGDGYGELGYGVKVCGEVVEYFGDEGGDLGFFCEFMGELVNLVGGRNLVGEEELEYSFGEYFSVGCVFGKFVLVVFDSVFVEMDVFVCIEDGVFLDYSF